MERRFDSRNCFLCGNLYDPQGSNQKYCSENCTRTVRNRLKKLYNESHKKERKLYRLKNLKRYSEYSKKYRSEHPEQKEKTKQIIKQWRVKNPKRAKEMKRRAYLKRKLGGV